MRSQNRYKAVFAGVWFVLIFSAVYVAQSLAAEPSASEPSASEPSAAQSAAAQPSAEGVIMKENTEVQAERSGETWTSERLKNAKPMDLPKPKAGHGAQKELSKPIDPKPLAGDGKPPTVKVGPEGVSTPEGSARETTQDQKSNKIEGDMPMTKAQDEPLGMASNMPRSAGETALGVPQPRDIGTLKAPYTSTGLIPESARLEYPYRTAGKLFFTQPGVGDFQCSAAVLRPRIILTAGHCVHKGSGGANGFYTKFLFIPAYQNGSGPFQSWNWRAVWTTPAWASGNGNVPNAADYAIIELEDRPFNGTPRKIGEVTGYLGWQINSLTLNHTNKLGYPINFDNAQKMHQVHSQYLRDVAPNNAEYGSDAQGGSSGGPWVQNFGANQGTGLNPGPNRIVGVTSYGYVSPDPKVQGSSVLDNNFPAFLTTACNHKPGNC